VRTVIIASGSRGDVEPYVALGRGLRQAGHGVRLVTHENYASLVGAQGIEFWPVEGNAQDVAMSAEMRDRIAGGNFLSIMALMAKEAERGALHMARGALGACAGADLLLAGIGGLFTGVALAEKLGLPFVQAYYIPFTPTRAYPSFLLPGAPALPGALNRLSYHLARQVMWQGFRRADSVARGQVLDLPPAPLFGPFDSTSTRGCPVLYGYSPAVIPPPPDWDGDVHVTGYWFLDPPADWTPSPALVAFLEAGPPPIYVGFGSMGSRNPQEMADMVLQAVAKANQRAILLSGWGGLNAAAVPGSVLVLDTAPFAWLFPRVAAVVHHGGAGTTAAALRAGVPSIVVPFFGDQPFWGRRVAELGTGPAPIPQKKLTAGRLAAAIERALTDDKMRQRATDLGKRIQAEDGIARAVRIITDAVESRGCWGAQGG
jgi:sterol 3beta-glucosyltransferase